MRALLLALCLATPAMSETIPVTPSTIKAALAKAKPGDALVLSDGDYGQVETPRKTFAPPLRFEAAKARVRYLRVFNSDGIEWRGGSFSSPREQSWAVHIDGSRNVTIAGIHATGAKIGINVMRSTDVDVLGNRLEGLRSDGINIAMSQRVRVIGNQCLNFDPILPIYDAKGKLLKDGDHPDCVQAWSRKAYPLTADILIAGNYGDGLMQGVWFEDYGDGGYDRVTVRDNDFRLGMFNGVVIKGGRDVTITGNRVRGIPGAVLLAYPHPVVKPWIKADGERITMCGNVESDPNAAAAKACW